MDAETAAHLLLEARRTGMPCAAFPEPAAPKTIADAYKIQDLVVAALGGTGGWKVGKGADGEITRAPVPNSAIHHSGAAIEAGGLRDVGLEVEFAFTLGKDLPPRGKPYALSDIADAIAGLTPLIEVIATRFATGSNPSNLYIHADAINNQAFVTGPAIAEWRGIDLTRGGVALIIDGEVRQSIKPNPARDPLALVVWLANHAAQRCGGLLAGQVVTTGSLAGATPAGPGARAEGRFGELGTIHVSLIG